MRIDTHVKVLSPPIRERAIDRGVDGVVYAPHFTPWPAIVERARALATEDFVVVPAREIFAGSWRTRQHVLALDLEEPVPDFLPLEETMRRLATQDACVVVPHPSYLTMSMDRAAIDRYADQIDAIEILNGRFLPWHGPRARQIADHHDVPALAASYAHLPHTVATAWAELAPTDAAADAVVEAIRSGDIEGIGHHGRLVRGLSTTAELGHLVYENTVRKLRQSVQSEPVPTHPTAPLYR